ncbi:transcriptional regulator [Klebsiella michiganensis]|nr:transcriptional regulator [Klebsiella michiganensis]
MMDGKKIPHYQRIARQLKQAIERGELAPGSRLPASRVYAQELGVSRATIETPGEILVAQGWLERRGQAGPLSAIGCCRSKRARFSPSRAMNPRRRCRFSWGCPRWICFHAACGRA